MFLVQILGERRKFKNFSEKRHKLAFAVLILSEKKFPSFDSSLKTE